MGGLTDMEDTSRTLDGHILCIGRLVELVVLPISTSHQPLGTARLKASSNVDICYGSRLFPDRSSLPSLLLGLYVLS